MVMMMIMTTKTTTIIKHLPYLRIYHLLLHDDVIFQLPDQNLSSKKGGWSWM